MATRSVLGLLAALLFATTWATPSGVPGDSRSPVLTAAALLVPAAATTARHPVVPQRAAPQFTVESVAQLFKSAHRSRIAGPIFRGGVTRKAPPSRLAPATGGTVRTPSAPTMPRIAVYNSLNQPGISASENAFGETPPDSTGAVGPANYVEIVNSEVAVFSRSGLARISTSSLHDFAGDPIDDPYCDVQVQWDPTANRWLSSFLFCDQSSSLQFVVFGWSKTSDPSNLAGGWCFFGGRTDPFLFDYPKLGHNSKYIIIGGNLYGPNPSTPNHFETAQIVWITKPAKGVTTCGTFPVSHETTSDPLKNGDGVTNTFTPVPVNTFTGSGDGYVVSAYDPAGNNGSAPGTRTKLAVFHLDSTGHLHRNADINVNSFTFPSLAPQLGSTNTIDTLDGRLTQAVGDPATGIWTSHTVDGPGPDHRSVLRWYEIKVAGSTASLAQSGDIASATDWVFNGAISPRFDALGAAVFYNRSSSTIDPVIAGRDRLSSTALGAMEPGELVLASSTAADTDGSCNFGGPGVPCRWGDYSGASPDPVQTNVVWGTNQFNASTGTLPAWKTQNFAVLFVETPANVAATAGDHSASVRWTAPSDPGTPITTFTINTYVGASLVNSFDVPGPAGGAIAAGLTNGVTYTFTVMAHAIGGSSVESAHSNAVTPGREAPQATPLPTPAPRVPPSPAPTATPGMR